MARPLWHGLFGTASGMHWQHEAGRAPATQDCPASTSSGTTQVLVIPMFRRAWLQHVCSGASTRGLPPNAWSTGETLSDKARLAVAAVQHWVGFASAAAALVVDDAVAVVVAVGQEAVLPCIPASFSASLLPHLARTHLNIWAVVQSNPVGNVCRTPKGPAGYGPPAVQIPDHISVHCKAKC